MRFLTALLLSSLAGGVLAAATSPPAGKGKPPASKKQRPTLLNGVAIPTMTPQQWKEYKGQPDDVGRHEYVMERPSDQNFAAKQNAKKFASDPSKSKHWNEEAKRLERQYDAHFDAWQKLPASICPLGKGKCEVGF